MSKSPEQFNIYSEKQAQDEAQRMQEKIKSGEAQNYAQAEKMNEEEILKLAQRAITDIEKDSHNLKNYRNTEYRSCQIDSHSLCHFFENYHQGFFKKDDFSFLDFHESFPIAESLLNKHIEDRIKTKFLWCDARILGPLFKYNMDNVEDLENFSFKPSGLMNGEYVELLEKLGEKEFYNKESLQWIKAFIKAGSPKEFFADLIKIGQKLPINNPGMIIKIIDALKETVSEDDLNQFVAKFYSPNDRSLTVNELMENIGKYEQAEQFESGIFVDVDGTLIIDDHLNNELTKALEKAGGRVVVFTGGNPDIQTEKLQSLGFPDKFLPVVSKNEYKGKILEFLIDDSVPQYQGFDSVFYSCPNKDGTHLMLGGSGKFMDKTENFKKINLKYVEDFVSAYPEKVEEFKRNNIDLEAIIRKLKLKK